MVVELEGWAAEAAMALGDFLDFRALSVLHLWGQT
jgi:hypothetical protein